MKHGLTSPPRTRPTTAWVVIVAGASLVAVVIASHVLYLVAAVPLREGVYKGEASTFALLTVVTLVVGALPLAVALLTYGAGKKWSNVTVAITSGWAFLLAVNAYPPFVVLALTAMLATIVAAWLPSSRKYLRGPAIL